MPLDYYFKRFFLKIDQCEEWAFAFVISPSIGTIYIWKVEFVVWEKRSIFESPLEMYQSENIIDWPLIKNYLKSKLKRGKQNEIS